MSRCAIVTGASDGIGAAVARRLLSQGWRVTLLARREDRLGEVASGFSEALPLGCDVTDAAQVAAAFRATVERFGRLDFLFNNAGIFTPAGLIDEIDPEDWARSVAVNQTGMFYCAREAFAIMRRQDPIGGRILNNGSVAAQSPRWGSVCYTVTKHAVTGLTKQLSLDGRPFRIAVGQIDIGNARTELLNAHVTRMKALDPAAEETPMMELSTVAETVAHLAALPLEANAQWTTLMASAMPLIGRG
ncbi:SDR family oxidoreductase [Falsigemmobacter faecalis]|uniref:SDR family oxidoreductase n=1 Tax=Falsigemmobacter faecalis TaxID=2488730 RepID=A0A3P3DWG9_9RHOB|nr:SDR family oxidoreductase [Falsigemmobacter faecalis]RRH78545.1 SDR family oxidoreductase [Falsigemmobacter faecalis]